MKIPVRYELFMSHDFDIVESKAIELGWLENKVIVKRFHSMDGGFYWTVEPYENDCHCRNVVDPANREKEKDVRRLIYPPPIR